MKSEWRVQKNIMGEDRPYFVYRLYDRQKIMHCGNIEYDVMEFADRKSAEKRAEKLNKMEELDDQD